MARLRWVDETGSASDAAWIGDPIDSRTGGESLAPTPYRRESFSGRATRASAIRPLVKGREDRSPDAHGALCSPRLAAVHAAQTSALVEFELL